MQFSDLFAKLFSGSGPKGLSGEADSVLPGDPDLAFFNEGLRRFAVDGDLVADPELIWSGGKSGKGALQAHLQAERPRDGVARFTDVLVIVNDADWERSHQNVIEPWTKRAIWHLTRRFGAWANEADLHLVFPQRPIGFRFLEDGGEEMEGEYLGLESGEIVTGLLSNQYSEPGPQSKKLLAVHLNLPGVWEGYRDVGSFFSDRILFTLGSHWLDSFHHPALRIPALYRLQQYADGSFVHIIHPDYQDSFEITSHASDGGPSVLTLAEKDGDAVAHMVLALADSTTMSDEEAPRAAPVSSTRPPAITAQGNATLDTPSKSISESGRNPTLIDMLGSHTVIPVELDERILTLKERGVLLQKIHFARFMEGYDVYIGPTGKISTHLAGERAAAIQVRRNEVSLVATSDDARVNGKRLQKNVPHPLQGDAVIELGGVEIHYKSLANVSVEGWPYLGELVRPSGSSYMVFGSSYKIGRDRKNKVRLPDEPNNDNIVWRPEMESGTIRSRTGEIPKSRFYTDSIMVASEHAEIDLADEPVLCSLARHCFTFVRRDDRIVSLSPTQTSDGVQKTPLASGDEILIGNCVFEVSFPPVLGSRPAGRASSLTAAKLAAAVLDDPTGVPEPPAKKPKPAALGVEGAPSVPSPPPNKIETPAHSITIASPPAAHGLGEAGGAPPPLPRFSLQEGGASKLDPAKGGQVAFPPMLLEGHEDHADPNTDLLHELLSESDRLDGLVRAVDESEWQLELRRPARLRMEGWMVTGDVKIANHRGAQVVVPENRSHREQIFYPVDYFELFVRGRKGRVHLVSQGEARLVVDGVAAVDSDRLEDAALAVVRRTADGEEDFLVQLTLAKDEALPDPRAMRLSIDTGDPMVRGLFTIGFPLRAERLVELGPIRASGTFDGERLHLTDYLRTYRRNDGSFHPFFVRRPGGSFQTAPEDGAALVLEPGSDLLAGGAIFSFGTGGA
jgi:hypothetical protein